MKLGDIKHLFTCQEKKSYIYKITPDECLDEM